MKKYIPFLALILFAFSCTVSEAPEFLKLDNYKILSHTRKTITLGTNAYFQNPNDVGCKIVSTNIEASITGLEVSKVKQTKSINLEANNKFSIPLSVSVPFDKISKDGSGILGGLLSGILNKNIEVSYKGIVTLKKLGIEFDIDVDGEETIKNFKKK